MTDFVVAQKGKMFGYLSTDKENTIFGYKFNSNMAECIKNLSESFPNMTYTTINSKGKNSRQFEKVDYTTMINLCKRLNKVKTLNIKTLKRGGR